MIFNKGEVAKLIHMWHPDCKYPPALLAEENKEGENKDRRKPLIQMSVKGRQET